MKSLISKKTYIFFIFLLIITYLRSPDIFNQGRFWGEDGSVFFQNALGNTFLDNFFKIYTPTLGYYNLFPRLVSFISSKFILELAPLVNVYMSYSILICIFLIVLFNESYLYKKNIEKYSYCLLVVICPTFVPEIWLNSVNSQIYFSVAALFILYLKDNLNIIFKYLNSIILFIGGFSSVYVFFLTPFFFVKYRLSKNKYNLINVSILLTSLIFQLIFYIYSKFTSQMINRDVLELNYDYLISFIYNTFAKLFFPKEILINLYSFFISSKIFTFGIIIILIMLLIYAIIETHKILKNYKTQYIITLSLFLIFATITSIIILFSGESFAGRYAALPGFIICLLILNLTFKIKQKEFIGKFLLFLSCLILISGIYQFRPQNNYRIQYLDCINNCVEWREQVKQFKNNNESNKINIWPYNKEDKLNKFEYQNFIIIK